MKIKLSLVTRTLIAILGASLITASGPDARAATQTWSGAGTDANWATTANWGGTAPSPGDALTFAGTTRQTNVNNISGLTGLGLVTFSTANWSISGTGARLAKGASDWAAIAAWVNARNSSKRCGKPG